MDQASSRKKIHRFIGGFSISGQAASVTDPGLAHQLREVLRLKAGEVVALVDDSGEYLCRLAVVDPMTVEAVVMETRRNAAPRAGVILYCAIIKNENFELVVQKATEVGVNEIVPVITRRTVKLNVKLDRLAKIAKEAAEQSGRMTVPLVAQPAKLAQAIERAAAGGRTFFFDVSGSRIFRPADTEGNGSRNVFIGPEGGWDENELAAARERGFEIVSLGDLVLRAETAAIVASYLACHRSVETQDGA